MHIHVTSLRNKIRFNRKRVNVLKRYAPEQLKRALFQAKASLEIEGLFLTPKEERLLAERFEGKMTYGEFLARAKEMAKHV